MPSETWLPGAPVRSAIVVVRAPATSAAPRIIAPAAKPSTGVVVRGPAGGLGAACLGNVTNALLLGRWFGRRLPTAMAIVFSASGAGVITLVPLSQWLIERSGWRDAYHLLGGAGLALAIPLLMLPWRRLATGSGEGATTSPSTAARGTSLTLAGALRHQAFWAIFSVYFFTAVGMFADRKAGFRLVSLVQCAGKKTGDAQVCWRIGPGDGRRHGTADHRPQAFDVGRLGAALSVGRKIPSGDLVHRPGRLLGEAGEHRKIRQQLLARPRQSGTAVEA